MKIKTAVNYEQKIHERLKACGGVVDGYTFNRVFVFGSVIRGKVNPGDLDVLYTGGRGWGADAARKLSAGMRYASLHHADRVSVDFKVMVEIYPLFNLDVKRPGQSITIKRSGCGIAFPEDNPDYPRKFPNKHKCMKRLKLSRKGLVHRVLDRYCRLHKVTLTGAEVMDGYSSGLLGVIYARYGFSGIAQYGPPGKLQGSAIRINFPLGAHKDNFG